MKRTQKENTLYYINFQLESALENLQGFADNLAKEIARDPQKDRGYGALYYFEWSREQFLNAAKVDMYRTMKAVFENENNTFQKACEILLREANQNVRRAARSGCSTSPASNLAEIAKAEAWESQIDTLQHELDQANEASE
jgi:hypothetical protein